MANTISTSTGSVSSNVVTYTTRNHGQGVTLFLDYNKGNGTEFSLSYTVQNPNLNSSDYNALMAVGTTLEPLAYTINATGKYFYPIPLAPDDRVVKVTIAFSGGTTQTLAVDFREN